MCDILGLDCTGCAFEGNNPLGFPCNGCNRNPDFCDEYTPIDDEEETDHGQE